MRVGDQVGLVTRWWGQDRGLLMQLTLEFMDSWDVSPEWSGFTSWESRWEFPIQF